MTGVLNGKSVVLTGGASGIGQAVVLRFVQEGARCVVLDIYEEKLKALSSAHPDQIVAVPGDVRVYSDHQRAVQAAVGAFGGVDIFVGNAGVFDGFVSLKDLPEDRLDEAFSHIVDVNLKGYLLGAKAVLPELEKSSGNMIFTLSNASRYPSGGGPLYTLSKHGAVGLIRQLAFELAPKIRVNGVAPGGTLTELYAIPSLRHLSKGAMDLAAKEKLISSRNPLRIAMTGEDHTGAYLLLASDQARAMTGVIIESDGGIGVRGMS